MTGFLTTDPNPGILRNSCFQYPFQVQFQPAIDQEYVILALVVAYHDIGLQRVCILGTFNGDPYRCHPAEHPRPVRCNIATCNPRSPDHRHQNGCPPEIKVRQSRRGKTLTRRKPGKARRRCVSYDQWTRRKVMRLTTDQVVCNHLKKCLDSMRMGVLNRTPVLLTMRSIKGIRLPCLRFMGLLHSGSLIDVQKTS